MTRRYKIVAFIASVLCGCWVVAWYGYLEPPWLSYGGLPWPMVADVRPNEVMQYRAERCNSLDTERSFVTSRYLVRVDKEQDDIRFDSNPTTAPPGCTRAVVARNKVPPHTPAGRYYFRGVATINYHWRTHNVPWRTAEFNILPPAPAASGAP